MNVKGKTSRRNTHVWGCDGKLAANVDLSAFSFQLSAFSFSSSFILYPSFFPSPPPFDEMGRDAYSKSSEPARDDAGVR